MDCFVELLVGPGAGSFYQGGVVGGFLDPGVDYVAEAGRKSGNSMPSNPAALMEGKSANSDCPNSPAQMSVLTPNFMVLDNLLWMTFFVGLFWFAL